MAGNGIDIGQAMGAMRVSIVERNTHLVVSMCCGLELWCRLIHTQPSLHHVKCRASDIFHEKNMQQTAPRQRHHHHQQQQITSPHRPHHLRRSNAPTRRRSPRRNPRSKKENRVQTDDHLHHRKARKRSSPPHPPPRTSRLTHPHPHAPPEYNKQ